MKLRLAKKDVQQKTVLLTLRTAMGRKKIKFHVDVKKPEEPKMAQQSAVITTIRAYRSETIRAAEAGAAHEQAAGYAYPYAQAGYAGYPQQSASAGTQPLSQASVHIGLGDDYETKTETKGGIRIPEIAESPAIEEISSDLIELRKIDMKYPLIPAEPKQGERVFAYAHIYYDTRKNEILYDIVEPPLDEKMTVILEDLKEFIQEKLDVNFGEIRGEASDYLNRIFDNALAYFRFKTIDVEVLRYYIIRDFIGLGKIEPLLRDKRIEDISCDGVNIPIYVYHRDPRFGSLKTNASFSDRDDLDSFTNKIAERCGKVISVAKPLLDGTLPDGSRVQATLGSDIAMHGSNFTIRMFTEKPLTPVDMIKFGTTDLKMLAYFWHLIEHNNSVLVSGGTATGKTSLLNALSLFIKPQMKIVSIEDTPELRLPHSHWVPEVARTPLSEEGKVDMFELLRESLRQRPDYIIVGEVRGKEAYVLFQQMAVGHAGLATIHAENFPKLMDRLSTAPISLPPSLIQNVDVIAFIKRVKYGRVYKRRIATVVEVIGYDKRSNNVITNEIFKWNPKNDGYITVNKSLLLKKIAEATGLSEGEIGEDIKRKAAVLRWATERNIADYQKLGGLFNLFYAAPDLLLQRIEYA